MSLDREIASFIIPYWIQLSDVQITKLVENGLHHGIPFTPFDSREAGVKGTKKKISVVDCLATVRRGSVKVTKEARQATSLQFRYDAIYGAEATITISQNSLRGIPSPVQR